MTYKFLTDKIEIRSNDKKYWVKGYAQLLGNKIDLKKSIITDNAKRSMLELMKTYDVAVDIEHDAVATDRPNLIPVAKVRDGRFDEKGLMVDIELNPHSPQFGTAWGSLKGGFLDALSIEFIPKRVSEQFMDNQWVKVIDDVELKGMAFTGRSATIGTNILEVMCMSINEFPVEKIEMRNVEEKKMVDEKKIEVKEEVKVPEPEVKIVEKEVIKEVIPENVKKELEELKNFKAKIEEEKAKKAVDAASIVPQQHRYVDNTQTQDNAQKSVVEELNGKSLRELLKEAIELKH